MTFSQGRPRLGAWRAGDDTWFRVWAPRAERVDVVVTTPDGPSRCEPLARSLDGYFTACLREVNVGDRYRYRLDGGSAFPDPASRFQPDGPHGASQVIDPNAFVWTDENWRGVDRADLIIYELHVGTFTPEGTYAGVRERLPYLADLGVTALELLPLAQCPGRRNWGYDGVNLFAPAEAYGHPDELRRLVDAAHRLGLAVLLDVVYNHLGPDGNYLGVYSDAYFSERHHTDWGEALNFDGPGSQHVREFFFENALHWVREYHIDGFRLDATHIIHDDGPRHFLAELTERVRAAEPRRRILMIAEDYRNWAHIYRPVHDAGWDLDAVWADAFHHHLRRFFTGDHEDYYRDYSGTTLDLATTIRKGWFYCGQHSEQFGGPHGTDPSELAYPQFVVSLQNHDQVGNRACGDRLNHAIEPAAYRAAAALLLGSPLTPMLFMGQEWGADTPFAFFTDHHEELGKLVTAGRRNEFRHFAAFAEPTAQQAIPDPQAESTFRASTLCWDELAQPAHAALLRLYRRLCRWRRTEPALCATPRSGMVAAALDDATILIARYGAAPAILIVVRLRGAGRVDARAHLPDELAGLRWEIDFTTEDEPFSLEPRRPELIGGDGTLSIAFAGPAAVILRLASN
ncbi:MAG: malto-oligosyltrehalose trehalohydrolase [Planctomycetota bacterium]